MAFADMLHATDIWHAADSVHAADGLDAAVILEMVPLGLGAAITPSLLALQVLVTSGDRWARRSLAVIAGNAVVFVTFCVLVLLELSSVPDAAAGSGWLIPIVGAAVLLGLALVVLLTLALAPVLVPPAARLAMGDRATGYLQAAYRFTIDHQLRIAGVASLVISVYLLVTGLSMRP
ncbi:MAG: hypothetical protein ACKOE2_17020 [Actinomycetales bacterium]